MALIKDLKNKNYNYRIYLTDFLKTNLLKKFAVIWVKRRQKVGFSSPRSSKITVTKKKERTRRKSEEKRKKAMVALLVFVIATLEIVFGRKKLQPRPRHTHFLREKPWGRGWKNCWTQKLVHLAITFSKIRVDINKVKYRIFKIKIR